MKQLLVILLLISSLAPSLLAAEPPRAGLKEEPVEPPKVSTGERIEIPDVGFSITPPNGWMVNKNSHGSSLMFEAPKQPNQTYQATIQVMVFGKLRYIDEVTMKEYGDLIVEKFGKLSNRVTSYRLRNAEILQLETGDPAILYYTEFQYDDVAIMQMHILISSATNHFLMSYTDTAKVFDDESATGLAIAYTSMHSAQVSSQPPWRWRAFAIVGFILFALIFAWFTMRIIRARKMARLGQRIEDEDNKEITHDEESQYYSRHTGVSETHADDDDGDWSEGKSSAKGKAAPSKKPVSKSSQVQSSHFDDDDEPEVSDVMPLSTLEKSLHPGRKRKAESAAPRQPAPPAVPPAQPMAAQAAPEQQPMPPQYQQPMPASAQQFQQPVPQQAQNQQPIPASAQQFQQPVPQQAQYQQPMPAPAMAAPTPAYQPMQQPMMPPTAQQPMPQNAQQPMPQPAPAPMQAQQPMHSQQPVHSQPMHSQQPMQAQQPMQGQQPIHSHQPMQTQQSGMPQHQQPMPASPAQPAAPGYPQPVAGQQLAPSSQQTPAYEAMAHAAQFGQNQNTNPSFVPNQVAVPVSEQPVFIPQGHVPQQAPMPGYQQQASSHAPAPVAQTFAPPPQPAPAPVMPQLIPAVEAAEQPVTSSRQPLSTSRNQMQPRSQEIDDDGPEMTEEARLSEILPKAGSIEKSKPKRKGLFWRKKADNDDQDDEQDQDEGGEDNKGSWKMEATKKAGLRKGKNQDDDDNDQDSGDQWAVEPTKKSGSQRMPEKDDDEPEESEAWAPEATKRSEPKKDSLLNETQGPQRLVRRAPEGPVTKEHNAAVTEDGWNLNQAVASDHDEEDEEDVG